MKVLLIANYKPGTGGISGQVEKLNCHLAQEGIENAIFSVKGSVLYRAKAYFRLRKIAENYDILHIHTCSYWGFISAVYGVKIAKKLNKSIILTYHGGGAEKFFAKHTRLVKKYLLRTDVNIVLSGFLAKVFDKYQIPYTIIPNIVELDTNAYRERDVIKPNYISVRTLSPLYNIECIIKAFQIVKKQLPQATLTIVGDGPSRQGLEKMVKDCELKDVLFTGRVANSDIYKYLDKADIMLSAPRIDNMPVSLLEAFNAGVLVISSNVGGVPYMINDGINGLLFESDNYKMLAEKMIEAIKSNDASKAMIWNAKASVKDYAWENTKEKLFEVYNHEYL